MTLTTTRRSRIAIPEGRYRRLDTVDPEMAEVAAETRCDDCGHVGMTPSLYQYTSGALIGEFACPVCHTHYEV